ncbi:polyphosphatase [Trichomonascus vanleenenianus]|uniref:exopolyphosphatase n=1 Tax=Trichomonascus vanleenenianus TaxID=2268995 RepID=UPI003ECB3ACB
MAGVTKYLQSLRARIAHLKALGPAGKALVVTGNESADLDSCVSSLLTAYYFSRRYSPGGHISSVRIDEVIPLISIPKADLRLRPDVEYLLRRIGVTAQDLVFSEDVEELSSANGPELYAFLVDFNKLLPPLDRVFANRVVGILDHHDNEGHYSDLPLEPRVIKRCGSCSSLVVNYWQKEFKRIGQSGPLEGDRSAIELALAPLLVDTNNMTLRVEDEDRQSFDTLMDLLKQTGESIDVDEFEHSLKTHKQMIEGMKLRDILRKDYKQWDGTCTSNGDRMNIGISAVVKSLGWLLENYPDFESVSKDFAAEKDVDLFAIMTSFGEGDAFQRELALYPTSDNAKDLMKELLGKERADLALEPLITTKSNCSVFASFQQKNLSSTRKKVAPVLRQVFQGKKNNNH